MKSKISLFSKAIISNNLRRFWWVSTLYTILLFLVGPLLLLNQKLEYFIEYNRRVNMHNVYWGSMVLICFVAVMIGTMILRYLQNSKSVTLFHSMPFTRLALYINNYFAGVILLIVPILVNAIILFGIREFSALGAFIEINDLWEWLGMSIVMVISLYSISVMVGTFTGSSIAQILFTYILNFLPVAFIIGSNFMLMGVIYGFPSIQERTANSFANLMPITQLAMDSKLDEVWIINLIITVMAVIIGYFTYKYRNLETAGDVISNKILKPIFKYGVTVCTMAVGTIYIKSAFNINSPNLLVYIIFALLGYVIAEMLLRKSFKILDSYKGFIGYIIVFLAAALIIELDITGYEKRVPDINEIDVAIIGNYGDIEKVLNQEGRYNAVILNQEEGIRNVTILHQAIIKDKKCDKGMTNIAYRLKNGKLIERSYPVNQYYGYKSEFSNIYNLEEYKKESNKIFDINDEDIIDASLQLSFNDRTVRISDGNEAKYILGLLKKSILNNTYEDRYNYTPMYYLELRYKDDSNKILAQTISYNDIYEISTSQPYGYERVPIYNCDTELINYFKEKGYDKKLLDVDRISYISISKEEKVIKVIQDKAIISEILELRGYIPSNQPKGEDVYYINIGNQDVLMFSGMNEYLSKYLE